MANNEELDKHIKKTVSEGKILQVFTIVLLLLAKMAYAGEADVIEVAIERTAGNTFHFDVTVGHDDEGWNHYADRWDVLAPDGTVLGTRTLYHPHVDEQPFTRSLSGVQIPAYINIVTIRAHDSVHGYGHKTVSVEVPR